MIEVKPTIQHQSNCPHCKTDLKPKSILWHGLHVCVESDVCSGCGAEIIEDLRVGHAVNYPYQIDLKKGLVFGKEIANDWLGVPLYNSLKSPNNKELIISKEVFKTYQRAIILNCIDFLYGHCLLKLLNAQKYIDNSPDRGLIVIVPKLLRWMVPQGVAEVWTVDISLKNSHDYYPSFHQFVCAEAERFSEIYVSKAHSHPSQFDISKFTGVAKHNFEQEELKITFVWREDRTWSSLLTQKVLIKLNMSQVALMLQNWRVQRLFKQIGSALPSAKFAVVGLGKKTQFPDWIEDYRVNRFDEKTEREVCQLYAASRLVIGVHGSNMLVPSGQAGMTIDLMPRDRWRNFAQDILYQEPDPRLASFRYRYLPLGTKIADLAYIASSMIVKQPEFYLEMMGDRSATESTDDKVCC
jgi:hypothetical protein